MGGIEKMTTTMKENDIIKLPDGFHANGTAKEWRSAKIIRIIDKDFMTVEFLDNGESQLVTQIAAREA